MSDCDVKAEYAGLVRAAVTGDRAAVERLLVRAQEAAYRFSLLVCGHPEDAEDVMQDALLNTYQHVGDISEPEAFRTRLYTTVRNACLMNVKGLRETVGLCRQAGTVPLPDEVRRRARESVRQLLDRYEKES